jgi:shikimate kinase
MTKIILVGYMGSGKSEIGKLLSKKLNLEYLDLDNFIANKLSKSINEIFSEKGEIFFRKLEHQYFLEIVQKKTSFVLSLGGGTPCYANNHELLKEDDVTSIYLKANVATLTKRLSSEKENRPLIKDLSNEKIQEFIGMHLFERSVYYDHSKYLINTDDKTPEEIVIEIEKILF